MLSEEKSAAEPVDSIAYLDALTGATDEPEDEPEQPEASAAEPSPVQQDGTEHRREDDVQSGHSGYSAIPEEPRPAPKQRRAIRLRDAVIIGVLTFAIGLLSAGLYAKSRINNLNEQLALKDEQIQELQDQNAALQEKLDSLPQNGEAYPYDFNDWFEQFGEFFGEYGNWFGLPGNGGSQELPAHSDRGYLGIRVEETPDGVRVTETLPNARSDVFQKDDIILNVDGTDVKTVDEISKVLEQTKRGDTVEVLVKRGGSEKTLDVELTGRYQEQTFNITPGDSRDF